MCSRGPTVVILNALFFTELPNCFRVQTKPKFIQAERALSQFTDCFWVLVLVWGPITKQFILEICVSNGGEHRTSSPVKLDARKK